MVLEKIFIKDYKNYKNQEVRKKYGILASLFGIVSNLIISSMKLTVGFLCKSVSIIADGTNNLGDASSSIISLIGFKISSKPADKGHPFGHQRMEYLSGLIVSVVIVVLGVQLIIESFGKIGQEYDDKNFILKIIILAVSILLKIYQALYNYNIGKKINSSTIKATAQDSRNDVIATTIVLIGLISGHFTSYNLDGYLGILVGLFVVYSGLKLIIETSSPLIGNAPEKELVDSISLLILSHKNILGIHDLQIYDYGPNAKFASCHVEVDSSRNILEIHDEIDNIEKECFLQLSIKTVLHMDPVVIGDPYTDEIKNKVVTIIKGMNLTFHDFRIVKGQTHTNIVFDVLLSESETRTIDELFDEINKKFLEIDENFIPVITFDKDYTSTLENK